MHHLSTCPGPRTLAAASCVVLVILLAVSPNATAPPRAAHGNEPPRPKSAEASPAEGDSVSGPDRPKFEALSLRGKVVWMADALGRRFGIRSVPESAERVLALETPDGKLYPLVEDIRGRAFRRDARLRGIDVELLVRRYERSPVVQVIRVFAHKKDGKFELDYWCEICAIAMFELKECDCCQGPIQLRERLVKDKKSTKSPATAAP